MNKNFEEVWGDIKKACDEIRENIGYIETLGQRSKVEILEIKPNYIKVQSEIPKKEKTPRKIKKQDFKGVWTLLLKKEKGILEEDVTKKTYNSSTICAIMEKLQYIERTKSKKIGIKLIEQNTN